jgi:hypothetical protein
MVFLAPSAFLSEYAAELKAVFDVELSESQINRIFMKHDISRKLVCSISFLN